MSQMKQQFLQTEDTYSTAISAEITKLSQKLTSLLQNRNYSIKEDMMNSIKVIVKNTTDIKLWEFIESLIRPFIIHGDYSTKQMIVEVLGIIVEQTSDIKLLENAVDGLEELLRYEEEQPIKQAALLVLGKVIGNTSNLDILSKILMITRNLISKTDYMTKQMVAEVIGQVAEKNADIKLLENAVDNLVELLRFEDGQPIIQAGLEALGKAVENTSNLDILSKILMITRNLISKADYRTKQMVAEVTGKVTEKNPDIKLLENAVDNLGELLGFQEEHSIKQVVLLALGKVIENTSNLDVLSKILMITGSLISRADSMIKQRIGSILEQIIQKSSDMAVEENAIKMLSLLTDKDHDYTLEDNNFIPTYTTEQNVETMG